MTKAEREANIRSRLTTQEWTLIRQFVCLRRALGLPQRAVDDRVGSTDFIEKLEAGIRRASTKTLVEWTEALGAQLVLVPRDIPITELYGWATKRLPPTPSGARLTAADRYAMPST